jgi:hypothetical protein
LDVAYTCFLKAIKKSMSSSSISSSRITRLNWSFASLW